MSLDLPTTRWSLVARAGDHALPGSDQALADLCESYWYPVYTYVRGKLRDPEAARDATQAFFATFLESDLVGRADPDRGRFRAFLLTLVKRFLINEWEKAAAQKRGGGKTILSFDFDNGETRFQFEPADTETPERIYERRWALTLLGRVLDRLSEEHHASGNSELFQTLKPALQGGADRGDIATYAATLGKSEGAVRTAIHRLRMRYRALLRDEVLQTVEDPALVEDEIRHLLHSLRP